VNGRRPALLVVGPLLAVLLFVLAIFASANGWFSKTSAAPVLRPVPTAAGCPSAPAADERSQGLMTVDSAPLDAVARWLPATGSTPCTAELSTVPMATARALATDIRAASKLPASLLHCPADSGVGVEIYFRYRGASSTNTAQLAVVSLSGCSKVGAPGRSSRVYTGHIGNDLKPLAPPAWAKYF
jgi:hypothetical protein